jgi:hypothetical protein
MYSIICPNLIPIHCGACGPAVAKTVFVFTVIWVCAISVPLTLGPPLTLQIEGTAQVVSLPYHRHAIETEPWVKRHDEHVTAEVDYLPHEAQVNHLIVVSACRLGSTREHMKLMPAPGWHHTLGSLYTSEPVNRSKSS